MSKVVELPIMNAVVDTREPPETGLRFSDRVVVVRRCLPEGDYTFEGLEEIAVIERKSKDDLVSSLTFERERFLAECARLTKYAFRAVVVEAPLSDYAAKRYTSRATPASILGSIAAIHADFTLPFIFCGSPEGAAYMVEKILRRLHARHVAPPAAEVAP